MYASSWRLNESFGCYKTVDVADENRASGDH